MIGTFLIWGFPGAFAAPVDQAESWARVNVIGALSGSSLPVYAHLRDSTGQEYIVTRATLDELVRSGRFYESIAGAESGDILYLASTRRPASRADIPASIHILYDDGHNLLIRPGSAGDRATLLRLGYQLSRLPDVPVIVAAPSPSPQDAPPFIAVSSNAFVAAMIADVQATNLYTMMAELTGEVPVMAGGVFTNIYSRNTYETNALDRALDYAYHRLSALGLDVHYQAWATNDYWGVRDAVGRNIIAERVGATLPSEIVIICAHIDSEPEGNLAPGADDNASGTIAVLTAARVMQNYTFDRTIRYVLFTGEEQGLLGSSAYAADIHAAGDDVVAVYNLDMLAYDSSGDGVLNLHTRATNSPGYAADFNLAATFTNVAGLYMLETNLLPEIFTEALPYSDHASFWNHGYPAILAEEGWPDDFNPHYHTTNDTIAHLNFSFYTAFVQATVAAVAHTAGPLAEISPAEKVSNAVHAVRAELETALGKSVPSLSLLMQTPSETFFASSAATPEQALTTNTTFRFASNTKNFTATAVLLLQQMGLLNVTNRIVDMIPGTGQPFIPDGANWAIPNKDRITIEQLLRHSAGVYDVDNDPVPGCDGESYTEWMLARDPDHQFSAEELVGQVALHQLSFFEPDEGYHYSNTGYTLLAEIVARVYSRHTGEAKTLADFLYDMNLAGTDVLFPELATDTSLPEPFSSGVYYLPGDIMLVVSNANMSAHVGEGNGYGTLAALNRHIRTTMRGEGVLNEDMLRLMKTNGSRHQAVYGLGCLFRQDIGYGHTGAIVGNLSMMAYNPDTDVSVAVYLPLMDFSDYMASFMIGYEGMYTVVFRALESLGYTRTPMVYPGTSTNLWLAAGETNRLEFVGRTGVYYGVTVSGAGSDVQIGIAPGWDPASGQHFTNHAGWVSSALGTYVLSVSSASDTPVTLRLYTLTNTIALVSSLVTNLMATYDVVGVGFSLVDGNHVVWQTGFGHADLERGIPADENTVFMIGSVSKTFGAIAAMQLAEEGLLDLDASITNALPDFAIQQRFADNIITPRTILTHHSGLPGDIFNQGFGMRPIPGAPDAVQAMLADETTLMPTNTFWAYNNSGFFMLGQMFRHITGQALDVFARERLFDRMGMTNSSIAYDLPYIRENLARPYIEGVVYPDEYVNMFFAGAIYSTPADMARYLRMFLNGGMGDHARVISNQTLQAMATKQNADIPLDQFNSLLNMGLGFMLDPPALQYMGKMLWHNGETVYFRTMLRAAIDAQLGGFFTSNSDEGGVIETVVVDSALKWAYEEKTGIAPPAPVDPGTPAAAIPSAALIDLATNGVFVTGPGYSRFGWDGDYLLVHLNAQVEGSSAVPLQYRENGWFTPTNAFSPQITFAEAGGYIVSIYKDFSDGVTNMVLFGERSPDVAGFDPAWSNRLGRWWATDMHPDDISWLGEDVRLTAGLLELYEQENMLLLQTEMLYVMNATNDTLAFAAGLGRNKGSALRVLDADTLRFMGVTYRSEDGIPALAPGAATNRVTTGDEIHWFRIPAAAAPLTLDLDTTRDLTVYVYTEDADYLGQANRAHAFHLDEADAQPLVVAVVRNGENPGPWTLTLHAHAVPFYHAVDPVDWPSQLVESAHRYPNADFGYVFVRENRAEPTAHLLKIAIVRMLSTNAAARPLLFLNGGPGDSGIRCSYQYFLQGFLDTHHIYLIDPRGVNLSQPSLAFIDDEELDEFQYRLRMLQQADFSAIHTAELAGDVNDVATAFGIGVAEADLMGQSYGTYLAQEVMRGNPSWLRAVVLDGVVAPNIPGLSQTGPIRDQALNAFFADVAANPLYPDLGGALYALAESLQQHPAEVPMYGEPNLLNGVNFLDATLNQLTSTDLGTRERIPGIVWRASRGETAALAELFAFRKDTNVIFNSISDPVQQILVIKHDMLPFDSLAAATNASAGLHPLLAELSVGFMEEAVDVAAMFDDYGQADAAITHPVTSAIPTLVINGTYDTQTGAGWAAEVASHLSHAHLVIPPGVGHGVLFDTSACALQIMRDFFANPASPPDTSCMAGLVPAFPAPWPAETPALVLGQPVTNQFPNAGSAVWYEATVYSNIVYDFGGSGVDLQVVDANADVLHEAHGPSSWLSGADGSVRLWLVSDEPVTNVLRMELPLLMRDVAWDSDAFTLMWQGPTGTIVAIQATDDLTVENSFTNIITDIHAADLLQQQFIPVGSETGLYFRMTQPTP